MKKILLARGVMSVAAQVNDWCCAIANWIFFDFILHVIAHCIFFDLILYFAVTLYLNNKATRGDTLLLQIFKVTCWPVNICMQYFFLFALFLWLITVSMYLVQLLRKSCPWRPAVVKMCFSPGQDHWQYMCLSRPLTTYRRGTWWTFPSILP